MHDGLELPRTVFSRPAGKSAPDTRDWRRHIRDRADADLLHRTAARLRDDPDRVPGAGLNRADAAAIAALLDVLVTALPHLDPAVRWQAVTSCRVVLGDAWQ